MDGRRGMPRWARWAPVVGLALGLLLCAPAARATPQLVGMTTGSPATLQHVCGDHTCVDTLDPNPVVHLTGPSAACQTAMAGTGWTITYNYMQPWNGTINITSYEALDYGGCVMGAHLAATYTPDPGDKIDRFRWVQIVSTNAPLAGQPSPRVDGIQPDDGLPFYWREADYTDANYTTIYQFRDYPRRPCPCPDGYTWWEAELYLADWYTVPGQTADNHLILYDGIRWGFDIQCVPEPLTLLALGSALAGLASYIRRRRLG